MRKNSLNPNPRKRVQKPLTRLSTELVDPVAKWVSDWIAMRDQQDALTRKWQDIEHRLSLKTRASKASFDQAIHSDAPEARAMRSLMRRIKAADLRLRQMAARVATTQSVSPRGTLAKIEMAILLHQHSTYVHE